MAIILWYPDSYISDPCSVKRHLAAISIVLVIGYIQNLLQNWVSPHLCNLDLVWTCNFCCSSSKAVKIQCLRHHVLQSLENIFLLPTVVFIFHGSIRPGLLYNATQRHWNCTFRGAEWISVFWQPFSLSGTTTWLFFYLFITLNLILTFSDQNHHHVCRRNRVFGPTNRLKKQHLPFELCISIGKSLETFLNSWLYLRLDNFRHLFFS